MPQMDDLRTKAVVNSNIFFNNCLQTFFFRHNRHYVEIYFLKIEIKIQNKKMLPCGYSIGAKSLHVTHFYRISIFHSIPAKFIHSSLIYLKPWPRLCMICRMWKLSINQTLIRIYIIYINQIGITIFYEFS